MAVRLQLRKWRQLAGHQELSVVVCLYFELNSVMMVNALNLHEMVVFEVFDLLGYKENKKCQRIQFTLNK